MSTYRPPIRGVPSKPAVPAPALPAGPQITPFAIRDERETLPKPAALVGRTITQAVVTDDFLALEFDDGTALVYER